MMHESSVLCLAFSIDSEALASGSSDGNVKIWSVQSGICVRKFEHAHTQVWRNCVCANVCVFVTLICSLSKFSCCHVFLNK